MTISSATDATRTANGQFAPGHSGNPAGRPKGARNRATVFAELLREGQAEEIVQRFVSRAMNGDAVALRVCFERLVAKPSAAPIQLDLAPGEESDPAAIVTAAIRGLADGEVSPQEAAAIARVALTARKVLGNAAPATRREATPVEDEVPAPQEAAPVDAAGAAPVIRLFPDAPPPAPAVPAPAPICAASGESPVSGQYPAAPARRNGTVRGFLAACR